MWRNQGRPYCLLVEAPLQTLACLIKRYGLGTVLLIGGLLVAFLVLLVLPFVFDFHNHIGGYVSVT